ncbi:hypothetical protein [Pseudonocardia sp.]|uniref:hypothetical protein n=1 Tax=Pseudonocardia sp. TaxID=60912 RepID=UPI003D0B0243
MILQDPAERPVEQRDRTREVWLDRVAIGVLVLDGVLVGIFGALFNPIFYGAVPLPMGAILTILILPWLVARAAEIDPRRWVAAAPFLAWAVTVGVLGVVGPGGDVVLPATWQSLLLCAGGLVAGFVGLRRAGAEDW